MDMTGDNISSATVRSLCSTYIASTMLQLQSPCMESTPELSGAMSQLMAKILPAYNIQCFTTTYHHQNRSYGYNSMNFENLGKIYLHMAFSQYVTGNSQLFATPLMPTLGMLTLPLHCVSEVQEVTSPCGTDPPMVWLSSVMLVAPQYHTTRQLTTCNTLCYALVIDQQHQRQVCRDADTKKGLKRERANGDHREYTFNCESLCLFKCSSYNIWHGCCQLNFS